jgi:peptide/nickel transport system permease protein
LLQGIIAVFLLGSIAFMLGRLTGNPLDLLVPVDAPVEVRERIAEQLGLNLSYPEQFFRFLTNVVKGDFGDSVRYRVPAFELFLEYFPNSLALIIPAFILAFSMGIPLGVVAALKRGRFTGRICGVIGVFGMATPMFWLGLVLIIIFACTFRILPAARMGGLDHYVLPTFTLAFYLVAGIMRLIRSSMLEQLDSEYAKLARIKGVSETVVVWGHCLRNSLTAALSFGGLYFAHLITGTIVIEQVFAWPGVGRLLYQGIMFRDYPVIQTVIILKGVLIIMINLIVDILYAYIDPRIRY